jgi:uncharacterized paraquat-inducible protein A
MRPLLLLGLHIGSLILLGLGWTLDMLTIRIVVTVPIVGSISLMDETRSVLGTLQKLWETGNIFPFILIALFGILIPIVKTAFIFRIILSPNSTGAFARNFVDRISKWAMADVFAIAILVSFLAAGALDYTYASFRPGFYYFAAYVVVSNVIVMFLSRITRIKTDFTRTEAPCNP